MDPLAEFLDNITLGPQRRQLAQVGDYTLGQPLSGSTFQQEGIQTLSEDEANQMADELAATYGLDASQRQELRLAAIRSGASAATMTDWAIQMAQANYQGKYAAEMQAKSDEAFGGAINRTTANVSRMGNLLSAPGALRNDAEYGTTLALAEGQIDAALRKNLSDVASGNAYSGARGGNMAKKVMEMRGDAASQRAAAQAGLKSEISTRKTDYETYLDSLQQGKLSSDMTIGGLRSPVPSLNVMETAVGPQVAVENARRGLAKDAFGTVVGGIQHATDSAMNMMASIPDWVKGGMK